MEAHLRPLCSPTAILCPKPSNSKLPQLLQRPTSFTSRFWYTVSTKLSSSCRFPPTVLLGTPDSQVSTGINTDTREWAMQEIRDSACLQQLEQEVADLELKAADSSFWDDRAKAQENLSALTDVKDRIRLLNEFKSQVEDAETIIKLTEEMDSVDNGLLEEAASIIKELNKGLDRFELTQLLSGPYDKEGAVIFITAGAGGTDAQDWAEMLLRMYVRWGEKQRYKTRVVEKSQGEEAGIKSATIEVEGRYAYGYLSGEKGHTAL
ncbi:peptide chain release factor PrfB1 chloroplastic [Prunus yedoensis var. nudiflora]|uniref:Peptide chain release factor PrfB1 chloroplastic n=1 Tax=Prunus yedoensis var. nudiflora TaxID=2094558 RepID=A0A314XV03_PRUYE|nr:peptide chain release factor PrfB1 chloroplastic [Prunus yedoensis var. nudiflora]